MVNPPIHMETPNEPEDPTEGQPVEAKKDRQVPLPKRDRDDEEPK